TSLHTRATDSKSPSDDAAKPASMTSTPSFSSWRAMTTFCSTVMLAPGDCSPSRKVVSKIFTILSATLSDMDVLQSFLRPWLKKNSRGVANGSIGCEFRWGNQGLASAICPRLSRRRLFVPKHHNRGPDKVYNRNIIKNII